MAGRELKWMPLQQYRHTISHPLAAVNLSTEKHIP